MVWTAKQLCFLPYRTRKARCVTTAILPGVKRVNVSLNVWACEATLPILPRRFFTRFGAFFARSGHMAGNKFCWDESSKTKEFVPVQSSLPMCGFIAQLVEHRTGIAEVTGSNPVEALIFFRLLLSNCLNWKIYGDDHSSLPTFLCLKVSFLRPG